MNGNCRFNDAIIRCFELLPFGIGCHRMRVAAAVHLGKRYCSVARDIPTLAACRAQMVWARDRLLALMPTVVDDGRGPGVSLGPGSLDTPSIHLPSKQ